jgi:hypothetical protein
MIPEWTQCDDLPSHRLRAAEACRAGPTIVIICGRYLASNLSQNFKIPNIYSASCPGTAVANISAIVRPQLSKAMYGANYQRRCPAGGLSMWFEVFILLRIPIFAFCLLGCAMLLREPRM